MHSGFRSLVVAHSAGRSVRATPSASSGGVGRVCGIYIYMELLVGEPRRVAIFVGIVVCRTGSGHIASFWGLRELPDFGECDAAFRGAWRFSGKGTAGRGRAGIIGDEVNNASVCSVLANVVGSYNADSWRFLRGDAGTIDACLKSGSVDDVNPAVDISFLLRQHASALFLVKKNYCSGGEAFSVYCKNGCLGVGFSQFSGAAYILQFRVEPSVEQHQKSEPGRFQRLPLADPTVAFFSRRVIEPVTSEREGLVQGSKVAVARVIIAVKAKIGLSIRGSRKTGDKKSNGQNARAVCTHQHRVAHCFNTVAPSAYQCAIDKRIP